MQNKRELQEENKVTRRGRESLKERKEELHRDELGVNKREM